MNQKVFCFFIMLLCLVSCPFLFSYPDDVLCWHVFGYMAALALYISILEQQEKYDAALEVLSGDLGSLLGREEDKLRLQVIWIGFLGQCLLIAICLFRLQISINFIYLSTFHFTITNTIWQRLCSLFQACHCNLQIDYLLSLLYNLELIPMEALTNSEFGKPLQY